MNNQIRVLPLILLILVTTSRVQTLLGAVAWPRWHMDRDECFGLVGCMPWLNQYSRVHQDKMKNSDCARGYGGEWKEDEVKGQEKEKGETTRFVQAEEKEERGERKVDIDKRQLPKPNKLINNVMIPINLEKGQLFSFMFLNDSLWANKSAVISHLPSKIELSAISSKSITTIPKNAVLGGESRGRVEKNKRLLQDQESTSSVAIILTPQEKQNEVRGENGPKDATTTTSSAPTEQNSNRRTLYISVTTCLQPKPVSELITEPPPQLNLYVSQTKSNQFPGPAQEDSPDQEMIELVEGYALHTIEATSDVYIGVHALNDHNYTGIYSAQVAASIDAPYHYHEINSDPNLFVADSDIDAVLLYTDPFTHNGTNTTLLQEWANAPPPFTIFVSDMQGAKNVRGLEFSYCGLEQNSNVAAPNVLAANTLSNVATRTSSLGISKLPRQQFYLNSLIPGTSYTAALAMAGHVLEGNLVGGGGRVFQKIIVKTLAAGNCDLIYDLSFCDQVAYSVPSNSQKFSNTSSLAAFYDNSTRAIYQNFEKVLAQIPCEISSSGQYSLARTCSDCARAYKEWLCAVNIPRCTDIDSPMTWLQPRALQQTFPNGTIIDYSFTLPHDGNTAAVKFSRNTNIDKYVNPGPYKEILPCQELCHTLVSSCPASLGFDCPRPGQIGFNTSYGQMPLGHGDDQGRKLDITCNFPGSVYFSSAIHGSAPTQIFLIFVGTYLAGLTIM